MLSWQYLAKHQIMKLHPNTTFIDYEGMPVSIDVPEDKRNSLYLKFTSDRLEKYCLCWDELPPRLMPADSALRNGGPCNETQFRKLVQQRLLEKNQSDTKQLLLYEYWFKDDGSNNKWKDWLSKITDDEIIILVSSLDSEAAKHGDGQDDTDTKRLDHRLRCFNSSLALTQYLNESFLFFLQDLSLRLKR